MAACGRQQDMNHLVPDFRMDQGASSSIPPRQQNNMQYNDISELLWLNEPAVSQPAIWQSQNPMFNPLPEPKKFPPEEELMGWLLDREQQVTNSFCFQPQDPPQPLPQHYLVAQPPIYSEAPAAAKVNFPFLRTAALFPESGPLRESMVNFPPPSYCRIPIMSVSRELNTSGLTDDLITSSPAVDLKRKGREPLDDTNTDFPTQGAKIESHEPERQTKGETYKKSHSTKVHNISEKRRRDRINQRIKSLQELIPNCSKKDKLSTLCDAIEYFKALKMQLETMSTRSGVAPMMLPYVQPFFPYPEMGMRMGMGMGMGMNMQMGMTPHMMQFSNVLRSGSTMPTTIGAFSQLNSRFPLPFVPPSPVTDQSRVQQVTNNQEEFNMSNFLTPHQQSSNFEQTPTQTAQNQETPQSTWLLGTNPMKIM